MTHLRAVGVGDGAAHQGQRIGERGVVARSDEQDHCRGGSAPPRGGTVHPATSRGGRCRMLRSRRARRGGARSPERPSARLSGRRRADPLHRLPGVSRARTGLRIFTGDPRGHVLRRQRGLQSVLLLGCWFRRPRYLRRISLRRDLYVGRLRSARPERCRPGVSSMPEPRGLRTKAAEPPWAYLPVRSRMPRPGRVLRERPRRLRPWATADWLTRRREQNVLLRMRWPDVRLTVPDGPVRTNRPLRIGPPLDARMNPTLAAGTLVTNHE